VKAIIYEKKLVELKPSHILSKIMAHELKIMPKSKKVPQEKPKNHFLQPQSMLYQANKRR
jgi:hypothetical protein